MTRSCEILIDHLPDARLSPNARVHWTERNTAAGSARSEAGWLAKEKWIGKEPMSYATIFYEFMVTERRNRDEDNFITRCKPWQDGLVDGGVLSYDDATHLKLKGVSFVLGNRRATRITVTEVKERPCIVCGVDLNSHPICSGCHFLVGQDHVTKETFSKGDKQLCAVCLERWDNLERAKKQITKDSKAELTWREFTDPPLSLTGDDLWTNKEKELVKV